MRLVAVDVDGTLRDSCHQLRSAVRDSFGGTGDFRVRIVLATARGPQAVGLIAGQLSFSPLLAGSGMRFAD